MSNIDEKAKNSFTIEMRIFENYEKVKHEIIKVIDFLRHAGTAMGRVGLRRYWILFCSMNARDVLFSGFFVCCVLVCP